MGTGSPADPADEAPARTPLPERMRVDLARAMRARERTTVSALRATLAAVANAEAPPAPEEPAWPPRPFGAEPEQRRLTLSHAEHQRILGQEIADRHAAIADYARGGRHAEAAALAAEIAILSRYLT